MKKAADAEKFRKFADAHQHGVYDKCWLTCGGYAGTPTGLRPACSLPCGLALKSTGS